MLDSIIRLSLQYRPIVVALAAAFLAWTAFLIPSVPLDVLPDLTAPSVTVIVEGRGMAPTEMEAQVTFPIEAAVNGAAGVRRVRSVTAVGFSVVHVDFDWGQDAARARQTVAEKMALAAASFPPQVSAPFLAPASSVMGEFLFLAVASDRHSPLEVRSTAENLIRRRLLSVSGVSQVIVIGGLRKQYEVRVDPEALRRYRLRLEDVENALRDANRNSSPGFRVESGAEYLLQGSGRVYSLAGLEDIVIESRANRPIRIRDIADVAVGHALKRGDGSRNGEPAVILGVLKQPGANTLALTERVESELASVQSTLPEGMRIHSGLMRQANFIETSLENLQRALRDGALLVVLVLIVFLMNSRAMIIALFALPMSVAATIAALSLTGQTINTMSLGGLAIAIGELVDDAIIDVENVVRRLRQNFLLPEERRAPALRIVYEASREIRGSVVFATLIVGIVFLPLFALDSVEGRLLRPLAFAYLVALVASLIVALTLTPVLCSLLLPRVRSITQGEEPWLVRTLKRAYAPALAWSLRHTRGVALGAAVLVAGAVPAFWLMGREFLPPFNEGALTISAVTLPGTSLELSNELGSALERALLTIPEVVSTERRTGRAELDEHGQGVESAEIDVLLRKSERSREQVLAHVREKARLIPGMNITIEQPISHRIEHMLSGTRTQIAVKIFGDDLTELRSLARVVEAEMRGIRGVVDLVVEPQREIPSLRIVPDPERAARAGLSAGELATRVETIQLGTEVGRFFEGQLSYPIVLRYRDAANLSPAEMLELPIDTPAGALLPLGSLARIERGTSPNFVTREGVQRKIAVQANIAGRDVVGAAEEIRRRLEANVPLPPGYRIEMGGQFESEKRVSSRIALLALGVIATILMVLAVAFRSYRDALLIMVNLPLALVGGVVGVFVAGGVLSLASLVGFVALLGIASRNGIMLVSHIRHLREREGVTDMREAVVRGASERLAPILMTALAAGLALVPIALSAGQPGAEIQAPIATVILFGLATSTLLNMFVVPALYYRTHRVAGREESRPALAEAQNASFSAN
jgi:CzcA family heavy metal efflux pump